MNHFSIAVLLVVGGAGCVNEKVCPLEGSDEPLCSPDRINTRGWEDSPFMSADGERLYFMYSTHNFMPFFRLGLPERRGPARDGYVARDNPFDESSVYVASRVGDGWGVPALVPIDDTTCCLMSNDGRRHYFQRGDGGSQQLVSVDVDDAGAAGPVEFHNRASSSGLEDNPHVSLDDRVMWFTSDREGGEGGKDLWMSVRDAEGFGPATNVASLNSDGDEDQVWISPAGDAAWFNRGGRIFRATRPPRGEGLPLEADDWSDASEVLWNGESVEAAEASLTADEGIVVFARVDRDIDDITIVEARRSDDGSYGAPVPVD